MSGEDPKADEPKPLEVRVSQLEDSIQRLNQQLQPFMVAPAVCGTPPPAVCGAPPPAVCGFVCSACAVCAACRACAVCSVCSACSVCNICSQCFECTCGPCSAGGR